MNRILLDTHTLIWLSAGIRVGDQTLETVQAAHSVFVSALSVFEIRIKQAVGKMPEAEAVISSIQTMGFETLDLTAQQTVGYTIFNPQNKDPYDNALVAVAIAESLPLVTADESILSLKHKGLVLIDARN